MKNTSHPFLAEKEDLNPHNEERVYLSDLDKSKTYTATVLGHKNWGVWTLYVDSTWTARGPGGVILADAHCWTNVKEVTSKPKFAEDFYAVEIEDDYGEFSWELRYPAPAGWTTHGLFLTEAEAAACSFII